MALKIKVKAGSINNLTDARYFASYGVDWLGLCLNSQSAEYVEPELAKQIIEWLYGPAIVGEFGNQPVRDINHLSEYLTLEYVQLGPGFPKDQIGELERKVLWEILVEDQVTVNSLSEVIKSVENVEAFVLNFVNLGMSWQDVIEGRILNEEDLVTLCDHHFIIIDMPLNAEEVQYIMDTVDPYGINIRGSEEEKVGFKQFDELNDLLDSLETEA